MTNTLTSADGRCYTLGGPSGPRMKETTEVDGFRRSGKGIEDASKPSEFPIETVDCQPAETARTTADCVRETTLDGDAGPQTARRLGQGLGDRGLGKVTLGLVG